MGRSAPERVVHRVVDREDLVETRDREDLERRTIGAGEHETPPALVHPLERSDERAEPARVEEPDLLEVDHDADVALLDELHDLLAEPGRRVEVDLSLDVDDRPVADLASFQDEFDGCTSCANQPTTKRR
jgi:hypothetical protein